MIIDVTLVSSHIAGTKLGNDIWLQNFKIVVERVLTGRCSNRKRSFPTTRPNKQKSHEPSVPREVPIHMPEFQEKRTRCCYCKNKGSYHKIFVSCQTCGLYRSNHPKVFCKKKGALRNFANLTGKHLFLGLVFNKVAGLQLFYRIPPVAVSACTYQKQPSRGVLGKRCSENM